MLSGVSMTRRLLVVDDDSAMRDMLVSDDGLAWRRVSGGDFGLAWYAGVVARGSGASAAALVVGHSGRIVRIDL